MDFNSIHLICGDDIYYEKHLFKILPIFRQKEENNYNVIYDMCDDDQPFIVSTIDDDEAFHPSWAGEK